MSPGRGPTPGREPGAGHKIHKGNGINPSIPHRGTEPGEPHQWSLDDALQLQPVARPSDPITSHVAGEDARSNQAHMLELVLEVHAANPAGMTDDELSDHIPGKNPTSLGRRRTTLRDLGYVESTGERRATRWGKPAFIWRITPKGLAALHAIQEGGNDG